MSGGSHVPMRMCVGCGGRAPQQGLVRITVSADGVLQIADERPRVGRSGYLHAEPRCWSQFASRKGAIRSLARNFAKEERVAFVRRFEATRAQSEVTGHVA